MTKGTRLHTVCLEGPDLSGKTSLYKDLHRMSGYRWNIQDRAEVSMLVFSEYYDRGDSDRWKSSLNDRLKDMNHRFVLLLPSLPLLKERYLQRGDEIHTMETLIKTHRMFEERFASLESHPNVLLLRVTQANQGDIAQIAYQWLKNSEEENLIHLASRIQSVADFFDDEALGVSCQYDLDAEYTDADPTVMMYEPEIKYYQGIRDQFIRKITKEIAGENEYNSAQKPQTTRRFVYAHDSCISMINMLIRDDELNVYLVLRSSDTKNTLSYDLRFITNVISEAETFIDVELKRRVLDIKIHSAHIIN